MSELEVTEQDINILNKEWAGFLSFKPNFILWALGQTNAKVIFLDKGNQGGGTNSAIYDYVRRILGLHPIESKNIRPNTPVRTIRFASETLPVSPDGQSETKNTIYPALKRWLPPYLIKKDITIRSPSVVVRDWQGGPDIVVEFVSYNQTIQSQAGVQRYSVMIDEESQYEFFEEQIPRLIAAAESGMGGDIIISLTPAENLTWTYEHIFERRRITYNSPTIIRYMKEAHGEELKPIETSDSSADIAVIRAATDDNPTFSKKTIDEMMLSLDDPDVVEVRRYGVFHQISGRIFKDYDPRIHYINREKYFPNGMPHDYVHARGIDFHEQTPWACGWIALSRQNEAFIYGEFNPSPEKMVTLEIGRQIAERSGDYKFILNLVDPRMAIKQADTGLTPLDTMNRAFHEFKRDGRCTGGYWQTWDTKSARGKDIVRERLKNSRLVGQPFNNRIVKNGEESYLPTLWVLDSCPITNFGFKNWRWEQWADRDSLISKEEKNKAEDKHSHFPITHECIFKHPGFSVGRYKEQFVKARPSGYENYCRARA